MKYIYFLFLIFLISSCTEGGKKQGKTISVAILEDSVTIASEKVYNSLCDSIFPNEDDNMIAQSEDTIINGVKYVYAMVLTQKYTLAFRQFNKEYGMYQYAEVLTEGARSKLYDEAEGDYYYEAMNPSPNCLYVTYLSYYETGRPESVNDEGEITESYLKYSGCYILDINTLEVVAAFYGGEGVDGSWNYCNQWVENDEMLFDPEEEWD